MRPDGTDLRPFLIGQGSGLFIPAWSPDGRSILMTVGARGPVVLYRLPPGGVEEVGPRGIAPEDLEYVFSGDFHVGSPSWSSDPRHAVFRILNAFDRSQNGLWRYDDENKDVARFRMPPQEDACLGCISPPGQDWSGWWSAGSTSWSPGRGNEIAYVTGPYNDLQRRDPGDRLAVYDTTTALVRFIHQQSNPQEGITAVSFSPDGEWIAFSALVDRRHFVQNRVWVIRRDGSALRMLDSHGVDPTWSPDGRVIYQLQHDYDPPEGENGHIFSIRPDGSDRRQITFDQEWVRPEVD